LEKLISIFSPAFSPRNVYGETRPNIS